MFLYLDFVKKKCLITLQRKKIPFLLFWSKIGHFSISSLQPIQARKMCSTIFQNEKTPFQAIKTASSKSGKIAIFSKGLTHGFGPKLAIFPPFFLGNIGQETLFYDILERENTSLGYKNKKFKKSKNCDFCKGVNPWFWSKIRHFSISFLGNIGQENLFYDILERNNPFLGHKNNNFKKWKNCDFCKGLTHGFSPKLAIFPCFVFRKYRPGKSVLRYSRTKKCLSRL